MGENDSDNDIDGLSSGPIQFDLEELSYLIRDLSLPKESVEQLASIVKEENSPLRRNKIYI